MDRPELFRNNLMEILSPTISWVYTEWCLMEKYEAKDNCVDNYLVEIRDKRRKDITV